MQKRAAAGALQHLQGFLMWILFDDTAAAAAAAEIYISDYLAFTVCPEDGRIKTSPCCAVIPLSVTLHSRSDVLHSNIQASKTGALVMYFWIETDNINSRKVYHI